MITSILGRAHNILSNYIRNIYIHIAPSMVNIRSGMTVELVRPDFCARGNGSKLFYESMMWCPRISRNLQTE